MHQAGPRTPPRRRTALAAAVSACTALLLGACELEQSGPEVPPEPIRPVRVADVTEARGGEEITLTGTVEAEDSINLAFRVGGQLIERAVSVGDRVRPGQIVARLDPETSRNAVDAARANVAAAMARLVEARNTIARYEPMLARGFVARQQFDRAVETRNAAEAQVEAAEAKLRTAENQLSFTELVADAAGTVTARGAEPGEVVAAGQMVVQLAREGGRDAVFDFPPRVKDALAADTVIEVVSNTDPGVRAMGRVREISPRADPVTRTFEVRVGLTNPPEALRLGSSVTGRVPVGGAGAEAGALSIPAAALTRADGQPAVWVVDPEDQRVRLRSIDVLAYELDEVLVAHGLAPGELVVTAGVQSLRPDQQVRLLGAPAVPPGGTGAPGSARTSPDETASAAEEDTPAAAPEGLPADPEAANEDLPAGAADTPAGNSDEALDEASDEATR